jgi:hypothetical protein
MHDQFSAWARSGRTAGIDWPTWNRGLYMLRLVAPLEVVTAAIALDGQFRNIQAALEQGRAGLEDWPTLQQGLDATLLTFLNAARRTLDGRSRDLTTTAGRTESDPAMRSTTRTASPAWGATGQRVRRAPVL